MRNVHLIQILKSNYCRLVFLASIVLVTLFIPKKIFHSYYSILGIAFILLTSLVITCFIRNIKDKAVIAKSSGLSALSIITVILGFGALQACAIGAPVCGASIGAGAVAIFLPGIAFNFLEKYSITIIILSLVIQTLALYFMGCFKIIKYNP